MFGDQRDIYICLSSAFLPHLFLDLNRGDAIPLRGEDLSHPKFRTRKIRVYKNLFEFFRHANLLSNGFPSSWLNNSHLSGIAQHASSLTRLEKNPNTDKGSIGRKQQTKTYRNV